MTPTSPRLRATPEPPSDARLVDMSSSLIRVARLYRGAADASLAELGLSQATAWPILLIRRLGEGVRQRVLAEELGIEAPSLVRLLDQLESAGYVQRRDDAGDRRAKTLHLTEAGRALGEQVEALLVRLRRRLFAGVSDRDAAAFLRVLDALRDTIGASEDEPARLA